MNWKITCYLEKARILNEEKKGNKAWNKESLFACTVLRKIVTANFHFHVT